MGKVTFRNLTFTSLVQMLLYPSRDGLIIVSAWLICIILINIHPPIYEYQALASVLNKLLRALVCAIFIIYVFRCEPDHGLNRIQHGFLTTMNLCAGSTVFTNHPI